MIKGITVTLIEKTENGVDDFGIPIYTETETQVDDVLIGEPTTEDVVNELTLTGKRLAYVLGIPKGDSHVWTDTDVIFFGERFRTYGDVTQGIDANIPLRWNKKVKVERYE